MICERSGDHWSLSSLFSVAGVVADFAFARDGSKLAAITFRDSTNGSIDIWRFDQPRRIFPKPKLPHPAQATPNDSKLDFRKKRTFAIKKDQGNTVSFSPDGSTLFAGFVSGRLVWWDQIQTSRPPQTAVAAESGIIDMAFSPDGRALLLGTEDGLVRLWNVESRRVQVTFDWSVGSIGCVAIAPDGLTAAAGGDGAILVWDMDD
jgi:WD40 repeat protein